MTRQGRARAALKIIVLLASVIFTRPQRRPRYADDMAWLEERQAMRESRRSHA